MIKPGHTTERSFAPSPGVSNLRVCNHGDMEAKTRRIYQLVDVSAPIDFRVHNNSIVNLERALLERVFNVKVGDSFEAPPKPSSSQFFANKLSNFKTRLRKSLPSTIPVSEFEFAQLYEGDRRFKIYQEAAVSLMYEGIARKDAEIRCFVKAEKINFTSKSDPAPRVIQPRSPRYNVAVGRYLKPIEKRVYKSIANVFGSTTVMKGLNAEERGRLIALKWGKFKHPVAIGLDASRFDQHVSVAALEWEHSIYLNCFRENKELRRLLKWQIYNKGVGYCRDGSLKYKVDGCRMSGDMNTALGNCLVMCAMIWSYTQEVGVINVELCNDGDDCCLMVEQEDYNRVVENLPSWFRSMGFTMKIEDPVYELELIEFCQSHPVFNGTDYMMVRDINVALAKDCVFIKPLDNQKVYSKMLAAVGDGGLSLTGGIPVWQDFYKMLIRSSLGATPLSGDPTQETGMRRLADRMDRRYSPPSPECRYSFWRAFGLTIDEQIMLENHYSTKILEWGCPGPLESSPYLSFWP